MEFGVFIPIANEGWIMSRTSPKYPPTFELDSEIRTGSCADLAVPAGGLQLNCNPPDYSLTVTVA
jgi:hypothetical protein